MFTLSDHYPAAGRNDHTCTHTRTVSWYTVSPLYVRRQLNYVLVIFLRIYWQDV